METICNWIEEQTPHRTPTSTSFDLPFSDSSKTILEVAVDEATRWDHRHIGAEHLFLALFSVEGLGAKLLAQTGADPSVIRARLGMM